MSDPTTTYVTREGDVLDAIVHHRYGLGADAVRYVQEANPHLRHERSVLPAGLTLTLPAIPEQVRRPQVVLWD